MDKCTSAEKVLRGSILLPDPPLNICRFRLWGLSIPIAALESLTTLLASFVFGSIRQSGTSRRCAGISLLLNNLSCLSKSEKKQKTVQTGQTGYFTNNYLHKAHESYQGLLDSLQNETSIYRMKRGHCYGKKNSGAEIALNEDGHFFHEIAKCTHLYIHSISKKSLILLARSIQLVVIFPFFPRRTRRLFSRDSNIIMQVAFTTKSYFSEFRISFFMSWRRASCISRVVTLLATSCKSRVI